MLLHMRGNLSNINKRPFLRVPVISTLPVEMEFTEKTMPYLLYPEYMPGSIPGKQRAVNFSSATPNLPLGAASKMCADTM